MVKYLITTGLPFLLLIGGCNDTGSQFSQDESFSDQTPADQSTVSSGESANDFTHTFAVGSQAQSEATTPVSAPVTSAPSKNVAGQTSSQSSSGNEPIVPSNTAGNSRGGYGFSAPNYRDNLGLSEKVFYVDAGNAGDDSNPGTGNAPFKTIQYAVSQLKRNKDHDLIIRDGQYHEAISIKNLHGSKADPIVIRAETPRGVVLKALPRTKHRADIKNGTRPDSAVSVENSSHLKIAGLYVNGSRGFGIRVEDSSNILLKQNKTYNTGQSGIKADHVDNIDIMWNEVQRPVQVFHQESLSVSKLKNFKIIGNKVHDRPVGKNVYSLQSDYILTYPIGKNKAYYKKCFAGSPYDFEASGKVRMQTECAVMGGEGIDVKDGSKNGVVAYNIIKDIQGKFGLYLDAWGIDDKGVELIQENIDIHHNIVTGSGTGMALSTENGSSAKGLLRNINIHDNIIYANQKSGFGMGDHGGYNAAYRVDKVRRVERIKITNNLFISNASHGLWLANPNANDVVIKDNVIVKNRGKQVYFSNDVGQSTTETHKYKVIDNVIDTTNQDYAWLNDAANEIEDLPKANKSNGFLTDLPVVIEKNKGVIEDVGSMVDTLTAITKS